MQMVNTGPRDAGAPGAGGRPEGRKRPGRQRVGIGRLAAEGSAGPSATGRCHHDRPYDALHGIVERRAGRAPGPTGPRPAGHQAFTQGLPDHRPGPSTVRAAPRRRRARRGLLERRRAQLTRRLATDQMRVAGDTLDVYARSLVEHSSEATEHDIAWLDRLIASERQKQTAPRSENREPHGGDAVTAMKGFKP